MCRFLVINSIEPRSPEALLKDFAVQCQGSIRWQGDGWGATWLDETGWQTKKSLQPIWEDQAVFDQLPPSKLYLIHARGASFKNHKGNLVYNQPFTSGDWGFVFNGFLNGVNLEQNIPGKIGSEKIFNLALQFANGSPTENLAKVKRILEASTDLIEAMNIGLTNGQELAVLCKFQENSDYYRLYYSQTPTINLISSVPLSGLELTRMNNNDLLTIKLL